MENVFHLNPLNARSSRGDRNPMRDFVSRGKLEARILFELGTTDRYIMGNKKRKALKNRVNLQWWSYPSDGLQNVGDLLSPVVVDCILKNKGLSLESRCARTSNLVAIGSVLGNYAQKAVVWGSGAFSSSTNRRLKMSKYDIRAVRGPLTRKTLIDHGHADCPEVYGDPAILLSEFYSPRKTEPRSFAVIEHYCHRVPGDYDRINPLVENGDWKSFVDRVCSCELVVSSSLHGIILAETYGVPAVWLASPQSDSYSFKYEDWYLGTGRRPPNPAQSVSEALRMAPPQLPNLNHNRAALMETFPYELWLN